MVEISEEVELELDLGLSIGGSFGRSEIGAFEPRRSCSDNGFDSDLSEIKAKAKRKQREKCSRNATESVIISQEEEEEDDDQLQRASKREKMDVNPVNFPVQYPYAPVQFVPYAHGFMYPCVNVVPCWTTPVGGSVGPENAAFRAVSFRGFRPFLSHPSLSLGVSNTNGEVSVKNTSDHVSPVCSSTVSDHHSHSSSQEGDGSRETITNNNSSQSSPEQNLPNAKFQSEAQSRPTLVGASKKETKPIDVGKPPRPQFHKNNVNNNGNVCEKTTDTPRTSSFPQMPYVLTRGDGPDGRTVTGLLYRYSKSEEVTIVCLCHGSTFSPAEFVQHAGGTGVSNPLKHITVLPPAL